MKVYYRDFEIIRVEAREGALEITARRRRRHQPGFAKIAAIS